MKPFVSLLALFFTSQIKQAAATHDDSLGQLATKGTSHFLLSAEIQNKIEKSKTWGELLQKFNPYELNIQFLQPNQPLQRLDSLSQPVSQKSFFDLLRNLGSRRLGVADDIHFCTEAQLCDQILHDAILNGSCDANCIANIGYWLSTDFDLMSRTPSVGIMNLRDFLTSNRADQDVKNFAQQLLSHINNENDTHWLNLIDSYQDQATNLISTLQYIANPTTQSTTTTTTTTTINPTTGETITTLPDGTTLATNNTTSIKYNDNGTITFTSTTTPPSSTASSVAPTTQTTTIDPSNNTITSSIASGTDAITTKTYIPGQFLYATNTTTTTSTTTTTKPEINPIPLTEQGQGPQGSNTTTTTTNTTTIKPEITPIPLTEQGQGPQGSNADIVGGTVGGGTAILATAATFVALRRCRQNRVTQQATDAVIDPEAVQVAGMEQGIVR
jgi:hypothetical protein